MRLAGKIGNLILAAMLTIVSIFGLGGCSRENVGMQYIVYYSNASADDITNTYYKMSDHQTKDMYTKLSELIYQMYTADYTEDGLYSAKPDNITINDYVIGDNGLLTIDFSKEYLELTNVQEIILRSAFVLTVIQIDGILGVEITVEEDPIRYSSGAEIGIMTADDFVNILLSDSGMLKQETDVTLFFANADGTALVPVSKHLVLTNNSASLEEYILNQLMAGPEKSETAFPVFVAGVELISVVTSGNVCYVNFGESFLEQEPQPVSDEILIYSIVNSLCRLSYVSSVQFLINGEPGTMMHSITDISKPFTRNRSLEQ